MLRRNYGLAAALAAALWAAPAAAEDKAGEVKQDADRTADKAADTTRDTARDTKETTRDTASDAKSSASKAADSMGDKARAMGQQVTKDDARILAKLHAGNEKEIKAGTAMKDVAKNDKVKDFAQKMVDDHKKMDEDLMAFAQKKGIDLTSAPKPADTEKMGHQASSDREYMQMMVQDHQKDVKEVREALPHFQKSDKELAKLLQDAEKKMQGHLKDAQKIQKDLSQRQARTPRDTK